MIPLLSEDHLVQAFELPAQIIYDTGDSAQEEEKSTVAQEERQTIEV